MKKISICLDVGGTYIKGALFSNEFKDKYTEIHYYPARSDETKAMILENFDTIFTNLLFEYSESEWIVDTIAIAFPGPFDYEKGISLIKGLGKFNQLYGINLLAELKKIQMKKENEQIRHAAIFFKNDAEAFAFGENHYSKVNRGAYFTIGTGLGSTFIDQQKIVAGARGIPESGMIYDQPFKESIIDDYASARGLEKIIDVYYLDALSGAELYKQAKEGAETARTVFQFFGEYLGQAIKPYISSCKPDEITFGGQISKSFTYFEGGLRKALGKQEQQITLRVSEDTTLRTLEGLFILKEGEKTDEKNY
ncbi:ROK family protein [Candidatus Enterococcus clewellii]|uniref:ROK family protein n=1 Tax=Candidatus Enterococcus clewellii TaxID=1834193 RepID=A0A242KED8_9ENTE|nr:ROK family protein [Enterococcus sp. 9E7_DIV0242]OTP19427.1 hypothetical protein A5888_001244 [Enterococcus sp. 9E7_DIV0242]